MVKPPDDKVGHRGDGALQGCAAVLVIYAVIAALAYLGYLFWRG